MKTNKIGTTVFLVLLSALFLMPFLVILINSVKSLSDILTDPLSFPRTFHFENYVRSWKTLNIPHVVLNTMVITASSILGIVVLSSMSAYWVVRHPGKITKVYSLTMVMSMLIPFAAIMLPLVSFMKILGLTNSFVGTILVYWGTGMALPFFILQGAVKAVPYSIEEAAIIDGVGSFSLFWRIVFPLMKPSVVTVVVMDIFWIWNDFMIPLVMLNSRKLTTVQFAIKRLFGAYRGEWDLALPGLVLTVLPIIISFVVLQKQVLAGVASGSIKS